MRRVHLLVEGQTEESVVRSILTPYLRDSSIWVTYSVLATSRSAAGAKFRGGASTWHRINREVRSLLHDSSIHVLTTMIDYYGMPADTPGMASRPQAGPRERVGHVEAAMAAAVGSPRFWPHLTLHELEAWVLAAGDALAEYLVEPAVAASIAEITGSAGGPELVNDGLATAPSKRLAQLYPAYEKIAHGPIAIRRAGLKSVLAQCPHAAAWIESLRA